MRILITGGCGFIGSHLTEFHLNAGDEVHVVDNLSTGSISNLAPFKQNPNLKIDTADIMTWSGLNDAIKWAERIYHLAAVVGVFQVLSDPLKVLNHNVLGTAKLLEAIHQHNPKARLMIASSSSVYGNSDEKMMRENNNLIVKSTLNSLSIYAISKITDEAFALAYFRTKDIPVTLIRLFNVVGPRQTGRYGMVVPRFVQQAYRNEPIVVFGDGTQTRSFCDVRDVVKQFHLLAQREESIGRIFNVGCDNEITIKDLAHLVKKRANSQSEIKYLPYQDAYGEEFTDIKQRRPDLSELYQLTGFKHRWTLNETIDNLLEIENGKVQAGKLATDSI